MCTIWTERRQVRGEVAPTLRRYYIAATLRRRRGARRGCADTAPTSRRGCAEVDADLEDMRRAIAGVVAGNASVRVYQSFTSECKDKNNNITVLSRKYAPLFCKPA